MNASKEETEAARVARMEELETLRVEVCILPFSVFTFGSPIFLPAHQERNRERIGDEPFALHNRKIQQAVLWVCDQRLEETEAARVARMEEFDALRVEVPHETTQAIRFTSQLLDYCAGNTPRVSDWSRTNPLSGLLTNAFGVFVSIIP